MDNDLSYLMLNAQLQTIQMAMTKAVREAVETLVSDEEKQPRMMIAATIYFLKNQMITADKQGILPYDHILKVVNKVLNDREVPEENEKEK